MLLLKDDRVCLEEQVQHAVDLREILSAPPDNV